jgi:hypothetical protein
MTSSLSPEALSINACLRKKDLFAGNTRPGEQDDKGDLTPSDGNHRRYHPAFAVTDQPDLVLLSISFLLNRKSKCGLGTSVEKSMEVAALEIPLRLIMSPCRHSVERLFRSWSDNRQSPKMVCDSRISSSRFWGPLPVIKITAGKVPVSLQASSGSRPIAKFPFLFTKCTSSV